MKKTILPAVAVIAITFSFSCKTKEKKPDAPAVDIIAQNMDTTESPGSDFFQYACGTWLKKNPIPASERSWGIWSLVQDETYQRLKTTSEEAAADEKASKGSNTQKLGDFWHTGMDSVSIEQNGIMPLQDELGRINSIKSKQDLFDVIAHMQMYAGPLFGGGVGQDEMNSNRYLIHLSQGGLGLPNRDYYFNNDSRTQNIRKEYVLHLQKMFKLLGDDENMAKKNADIVMKLESDLAKASRKLEDLRDPYANYNKMSVAEVGKLAPSVNWKDMMEKMGAKNVDTVIVGQPEFYKQVEKSINTVSIEDWKTYLRWNLINSFADNLSSPFDQEHFNFYGTIMSGTKEMRPRWKRVLDKEENAMGDILGQLYVEKYYSPETKKRYQKLTDNILSTYAERIKNLDWMSDSTKTKALEKLNSVTKKVGYPDKWKDYSSMDIDRSSYAKNVMSAHIWEWNYDLSKLNKPVDRTEWDMTPQTYNAYYNPSNNEIVLPAAIFIIPGLPDSLADDAVIYGYAGASTIGHEITHGFDDEGRQYDAKGNLKDWWTKEDAEKFMQNAQKMVNEFNNFKVLDSMHVNGKATLGENIADFGGITLGYYAFQKTEQYKSGKKINGLTPDQRYFLGYALSWLGHFRDQSIARQILTDVHSPNFIRINGPLENVPEFYTAFNIKEGDKMFLADSLRAKIW